MSQLRSISVLLFVLALATCCLSCSGGSPTSTVKRFYSNMEKGEIEAALDMFSERFLAQVPRDKLKLAMQETTREIERKGGIKKFEITDEKTIGEIADVTVRVEYGDGSKETETFKLVKEDGRWKLQSPK